MDITHAPEGGDNTPMDETESESPVETQANQVPDLRVDLDERFNQFESRLLSQLAPKKPEITPEQYQELLKTNPQAAIDLALERKVQEKLKPLEHKFAQDRMREQFDQRVESEFPALKTDAGFQKAVRTQMQEFLKTGEHKSDSPTLVYRAAQIAALGYKSQSKPKPASGISSEAPSTGERPSRTQTFNKPSNFDALSKVFGLTKESTERLQQKLAAQQKGGKS